MAEQQSGTEQNDLQLDWSPWSVGPTQLYPSTTIRPYCPPSDGCDDSQPYPPYHQLSSPGFSSTTQWYPNEPETPHHEESHNPEELTEVFSSSRYDYLEEEERFILNARLRDEPWKVTKEAYKNRFKSFPYESLNVLSMRVDRLKKKYPEVKAILEKSNLMKKANRSKKKKRQTVRTSGADDDTLAANDGEVGVQRLSAEDAIRAAQTVLYFLGQPDCDGLVPPDDCMALIRILSQLNQFNLLNQQ